ncbi:hypothetical protein AgCh_010738 [Apium graveolens]
MLPPKSIEITRTGIYNLSFRHCDPRLEQLVVEGMFEMTLWYSDYAKFNEIGVRPNGITAWAVTFGTVKHPISRLIIIMISIRYGGIRSTLGGPTKKVMIRGVTFFVASEVLELVERLVLSVIFLERQDYSLFFLYHSWMHSLLLGYLPPSNFKYQARRMMVKLDMYRKFTNALAVAVLVSIGWKCYHPYFKSTDMYNEH